MKRRSLLVLLCILVVATAAWTGGSQQATQTEVAVNPGGVFPIVDEPITMTAFAPLNTNVTTLSIERNLKTQWVAERTGIRLDFVEVPTAESEQRLNVMLAAGDYTDVIIRSISKSAELLYGQSGVLVKLNDYIEEYGVETKRMWEDGREHVRLNQTQVDGNIYGMAAVNECFHCFYSQKMWVNTEWLDALGLDTPETIEDFHEMLLAFKTQDPNGNGIADEIPLAGSYVDGWNTKIDAFLMMPFVYHDGGNRHFIRDGQIIQAYTQPEWRDGLMYINQLYRDGLILTDTFTQDQRRLMAVAENPDVAILGAFTGGHVGIALQMGGPSGRDQIYKTIPPLVGPSGERYARYTPSYGWNNYFITNKNANPAAAFRLGDFMYTEEFTVWNGWGMKGDTWTDPDPGAVGLDGESPATRKMVKSWGTGDPLAWWNQLGSFLQSSEFGGVRGGAQRSDNPSDLEVILFDETVKNYYPYTPPASMIVPPLSYSEAVAAELSELETALNGYVDEATARFITGDLDVNGADWERFQDELRRIGVDRYVRIKQEAFEASPFFGQ